MRTSVRFAMQRTRIQKNKYKLNPTQHTISSFSFRNLRKQKVRFITISVQLLFAANFFDTLIILFVYMFIYNLSLFIIFTTLQQFVSFEFKSLYSFSDLKFNFYFVTLLSSVLLSIAGVPPFIGFFTKLLILINLINSSFFIFYIFFFSLLFFGLYFYLQNIRFLYSSGTGKISYAHFLNIRLSSLYYYTSFIILFFIYFGFSFMDDIILYFIWLFS